MRFGMTCGQSGGDLVASTGHEVFGRYISACQAGGPGGPGFVPTDSAMVPLWPVIAR